MCVVSFGVLVGNSDGDDGTSDDLPFGALHCDWYVCLFFGSAHVY